MTPTQLWNLTKAFVEKTIPEQPRTVRDEVAAKIYQEMKFLTTAETGEEHGK